MPPTKSFTSKRSIREELALSREHMVDVRRYLAKGQLLFALKSARDAAEAAEEAVTRLEERLHEES